MPLRKYRYSYLIRPLFVLIDILIIIGVVFYISDPEFFNPYFLTYIILFWLIIAFNTNFYQVFRFTKTFRVFKLLFIQFALFFLGYFTYFGVFKEGVVVHNQLLVLSTIIGSISLFKLISFYTLKKYRLSGKNYRRIVIIGYDDTSKRVIELFNKKSSLGYRFIGFFSDKYYKKEAYLGKLNDSFNYILTNNIDQIYCTLSNLNRDDVKEFTKFAARNNIIIKLIPDSNELYSKSLGAEYYDNLLVLNVKKLPFEILDNRYIKRTFDIIFSFLIIILVMSWLTPLLWIIVKLESKGPLFFKQEREGKEGEQFVCYKFRSMKINNLSDKIHATKNDARVTRSGFFLRKTSIDELPQFFNVLKGEMSVVGPRPHMSSLSLAYQKEIDSYVQRFSVKPGITGLAQVSGYRGEVRKKSDIKNRIRLDIFYIENWSFLLDIKIIIQTILNVFKGEEKAY
ncbi:undecaprenyl-phosphate glucose phosphotransferase [Aureibaculum algae]|uniref:Undecaprenyl-phosphate glucose phosphotransferase n=1 Tax=Aureibaculum algae TaxID=2584122 RepID=A0A5B7TPB3_9FLAO|nr:undecaprenyl-phosphate glucose phosphotransferase [Aureibaculum algae]QCX37003.1 undecaprenyl-phosphate glucose phosphotransferase [Aureibaculum algae]